MPGILGLITTLDPRAAKSQLSTMLRFMLHESFYTHGTYALPERGCYLAWVSHPNSFSDCNPITTPTKDVVLIFSGEHFSHRNPQSQDTQGTSQIETTPDQLLRLYMTKGEDFLSDLNGWFAGVVVDLRHRTILLFNDRFGMHRVYYHEDRDSFAFASEAKSLLSIRPSTRSLAARGLGEFLRFGSVLQNRTLFSSIFVLPAGSSWRFHAPSEVARRSYFNASAWERQPALDEEVFYARLRNTLSQILPTYFKAQLPVGVSLTGGLDTRILMAGRPRLAGPTPCYTYGGIYRDCFDVRVARQVAGATALPHHLIALGTDFFANFGAFAARTVWLTDGCLDISGSHELYFSQQARKLAPVRLTGNYGSEILRGVSTFKPTGISEGLFDTGLAPYLREALASFAETRATHPVSFAAFREIPYNLYGRLAAAQSQLVLRSPYMDNRLVALMYQAAPAIRATNRLSLRLIADMNASLSRIPTDMGNRAPGVGPTTYLRRLHRYLTFKAEWYYNAGMPDWLARFDHNPAARRLERLFLGTHKIEHYRIWFRDQLFAYVQTMLSAQSSATRSYLNQRSYRDLVNAHRTGAGNCFAAINKLLTLELVHRLLLDRDYAHPSNTLCEDSSSHANS